MTTAGTRREPTAARGRDEITNGAALAAFLGAGIGAFAMGFFVIVNEAGIFVAPTLHTVAGGLSGRTTFAVVAWLIAWGLLHSRWKDRQIASGHVYSRHAGSGGPKHPGDIPASLGSVVARERSCR
jgi:hypothetical protein